MACQQVELLAPAGRMDVLHSVVAAGADAVYLGGKRFNMRALKNDYNFTDDEIKYAVDYLHQKNRKIYITVNNLYDSKETDDIAQYLVFLQGLGIDALIVQDLGIVDLYNQMHLNIPLHASVQMAIANLEACRILEDAGFQRVILSKNVSLQEVQQISGCTSLGLEYFVHGDLCISHTGQCYMSSFISGESGNRGRCQKPCRWQYELQGCKEPEYDGYQYFLAHKDLCLYPYLPEMIAAGISSFKVEGRMRSAAFLSYLISTYRRALDRLIEAPDSYHMDEGDWLELQKNRIREYSAGNLIEPLDRKCVSFDGQREPVKTVPKSLNRLDLTNPGPENIPAPYHKPELTLRIGKLEGLQANDLQGVDNLILGCDPIRQNGRKWESSSVKEASKMLNKTGIKIYLETPRIVSQNDLTDIRDLEKMAAALDINGLVVNDLGSLNVFKNTGLELWGGYGLNIFNHNAASLLQGWGISRITASLEISPDGIETLLKFGTPTELMVHGPLTGMVSDFCVIRAAQAEPEGECSVYCCQDDYALLDRCGQRYRIATDYKCRNYLLFPYDLCLFPYLPRLSSWGLTSLRIEGQYYKPQKIKEIITCYREGLQQIEKGFWEPLPQQSRLADLFPEGLTAGLWGDIQPH